MATIATGTLVHNNGNILNTVASPAPCLFSALSFILNSKVEGIALSLVQDGILSLQPITSFDFCKWQKLYISL